jgi:hypothetical protein
MAMAFSHHPLQLRPPNDAQSSITKSFCRSQPLSAFPVSFRYRVLQECRTFWRQTRIAGIWFPQQPGRRQYDRQILSGGLPSPVSGAAAAYAAANVMTAHDLSPISAALAA